MPQFHSDAATTATNGMTSFIAAYVMSMYWTSTGDDEQPSAEIELSDEGLDACYRDCLAFMSEHANLLAEAYERDWYSEASAGHDFWLTRNGHGAGFWDRAALEDGELGERLSEAARKFGAADAYEGDDGKLYVASA